MHANQAQLSGWSNPECIWGSSNQAIVTKAFPFFCITEDTKPYIWQFKAMDSKTTIQCNKLLHLETSMVMYGIYNAETLENLINTVHYIHNFTTPY